ncbi:hypothetical protein CC78DRAFT_567160 [Lojkania enalia]|uniref:F-box domain-containing protein n=1 Tax=Lojkania enalia TaxID=147567 RepID=A0A9P4KDA4_9PLEO|nr:hypothetical protein CC78DRAFT_567160 [Didymosphaeria enalia]
MSSLLSLSSELLWEVMSHLSGDSSTLLSVCLTCHRLRDISQRSLFQHVVLNSDVDIIDQFYGTLEDRSDLAASVRRLVIDIPRTQSSSMHQRFNRILALLPGLDGFHYRGQPFNPWQEPAYFRPVFHSPARPSKLRFLTWQYQMSPKLVEYCMLLEGIKSISCQEIRQFTPPYNVPEGSKHKSSVETLQVRPIGGIPVSEFRALLMIPKFLRRLIIDDSGTTQVETHLVDWMLGPIEKTLEELRLHNQGSFTARPLICANFSGFVALRKLWAPFRYLISVSGLTANGQNHAVAFVEHPSEEISFNDCLLGLVAGKSTKFKSLSSVTLEAQPQGVEQASGGRAPQPKRWISYKDMHKAFDEIGIKLELVSEISMD